MKRPPTARDVARRAFALKETAGFALASPSSGMVAALRPGWTAEQSREFTRQARADRDERVARLRRWKDCFTPREWRLLASRDTPEERDQIDASWRSEGVHVLAWALGAVPRLLPFDKQASLRKLKGFAGKGPAALARGAKLRPRAELEAARELAEFWHWRSRTRQLQEGRDPLKANAEMLALGIRDYDDIARKAVIEAVARGELRRSQVIDDDFKVGGKAYRDLTHEEWSDVRSITVERHFTLNWLCGHAPRNSWERTPTDT